MSGHNTREITENSGMSEMSCSQERQDPLNDVDSNQVDQDEVRQQTKENRTKENKNKEQSHASDALFNSNTSNLASDTTSGYGSYLQFDKFEDTLKESQASEYSFAHSDVHIEPVIPNDTFSSDGQNEVEANSADHNIEARARGTQAYRQCQTTQEEEDFCEAAVHSLQPGHQNFAEDTDGADSDSRSESEIHKALDEAERSLDRGCPLKEEAAAIDNTQTVGNRSSETGVQMNEEEEEFCEPAVHSLQPGHQNSVEKPDGVDSHPRPMNVIDEDLSEACRLLDEEAAVKDNKQTVRNRSSETGVQILMNEEDEEFCEPAVHSLQPGHQNSVEKPDGVDSHPRPMNVIDEDLSEACRLLDEEGQLKEEAAAKDIMQTVGNRSSETGVQMNKEEEEFCGPVLQSLQNGHQNSAKEPDGVDSDLRSQNEIDESLAEGYKSQDEVEIILDEGCQLIEEAAAVYNMQTPGDKSSETGGQINEEEEEFCEPAGHSLQPGHQNFAEEPGGADSDSRSESEIHKALDEAERSLDRGCPLKEEAAAIDNTQTVGNRSFETGVQMNEEERMGGPEERLSEEEAEVEDVTGRDLPAGAVQDEERVGGPEERVSEEEAEVEDVTGRDLPAAVVQDERYGVSETGDRILDVSIPSQDTIALSTDIDVHDLFNRVEDIDIHQTRQRRRQALIRQFQRCWTCFQGRTTTFNLPCHCVCNCQDCVMTFCARCGSYIEQRFVIEMEDV